MKRVLLASVLELLALVSFQSAKAQIFGNALSITNAGTVTVTLPAAITNNYTVSAWVFLRSGTANLDPGTGLLSSQFCGSTAEVLLRAGTGAAPHNIELGRCNNFFGTFSSDTIPLNVWTHVAVAVSETKIISYFINGSAAGSWDGNGLDLSIGPSFNIAENSFRKFNGIIDEFQVWTNALPQSQIQTNRLRPLVGNEPGLYLYYRFNSSSGTVATNSAVATAPNYNGTLTVVSGSPAWVTSSVPLPPDTYTSNATAVTFTGATLNGSVNPNGSEAGAWFEWGPTTNYGNRTVTNFIGSGAALVPQSAVLSGLTPGAIYHYRIAATNVHGTSYGSDQTFVPGFITVTTLADSGEGSLRNAIALAGSGAVINFATNGTITLTSAELLINQNLTIVGPGATNLIISGNNARRVFNIAGGTVNISGLTVQDGRTPNGTGGAGAGIYNAGTLNLTNCVVASNRSGDGANRAPGSQSDGGNGGNGAGIYNANMLRMHGCTVNNNVCGNGGTGSDGHIFIYTGKGGIGGQGGGLYNAAAASATVELSTFVNNSTGSGGTGGSGNYQGSGPGSAGGAGGSGGAIFSAGSLAITASTISSNSVAAGGPPGAGPQNGGAGVPGNGGGVANTSNCVPDSSIISGNSAVNTRDVFGSFSSAGHNFIGQTNGSSGFGASGDILGSAASPLDPLLGPLQLNGGQTPTMALLGGSRAIEAGNDAITGTDQRGFPRLSGDHVDIGAYELDISTLPFPTVASLGLSIGSPNAAFGNLPVTFNASVNPGGIVTVASVQFGVTSSYGGTASFVLTNFPMTNLNLSLPVSGFAPGIVYHYRIVATNARGFAATSDQVFVTPARYALGDADGDGVVDQSELNSVLSNYFPTSPWLYLTNVAGLGGTNVTFSLAEDITGNFSVESSTNLVDWQLLGPATPRYLFNDTNAPTDPQTYYRLRWP